MNELERTYIVTYLTSENARCTLEVRATSKAHARTLACKVSAVATIRRVDPVQEKKT